ncbi:hypothetical protein K490DRAFT_69028 [Saccharata proteae CBS 121410]|uniref:MYND-type zinc finger protein samB n=1 Tax=Saccharata proteae CBS 121410 TaxID=1314787 RepID=A0A9P4HRG2_9PEZI|nr:hypothetical protein K490DRAFT_69028 [Saccharata proteae CBS 121410]
MSRKNRGAAQQTVMLGILPHDEKLRIANAVLAAGSPGAALDLYTELLKAGHAGHPYAFLNRSLCYLLLDYPSLAAADAYRAMIAGQVAQDRAAMNPQGLKIFSYGTLVNNARKRGENWSKPDTSFAGGKATKGTFLRMKLADLGCCDRATKGRSVTIGYSKDVILRGHFRLALALFKCGGGALRSALDILNDAEKLPFCTDEDTYQFDALGNHILESIEEEFLLEKDDTNTMRRSGLLPAKRYSSELEAYQMRNLRGLLQTRYTKIKRELYPWDTHSLRDLKDRKNLHSINKWVQEQAPGCSVRASNTEGKVPKLSLHADRNFDPGIIYEETSAFHVSSSLIAGTWLSCDSCGAAMDVPAELMTMANQRAENISYKDNEEAAERYHQARSLSPRGKLPVSAVTSEPKKEPKPSLREEDNSLDQQRKVSNGARTAADKELKNGEVAPGHNLRLLSPSTQSARESSSDAHDHHPDRFRLCEMCRGVAYCDASCQAEATDIHLPMCGTGLDEAISHQGIRVQWRDLPSPEQQTLLNLMVLRILSMFRGESVALAYPWMQVLDGNLDEPRVIPDNRPKNDTAMNKKTELKYDDFYPPELRDLFHDYDGPTGGDDEDDKEPPNMMPWSFDANVRFPIQCLLRLGGPSAALEVKRYDGWVLNTIIAKVEAAMRITKQHRFEKYFDAEGNLTGQRPVPIQEKGDGHSSAWIGSLHPLSTLIPVAVPGQVPNVIVEERLAHLSCKALNRIHPQETFYTDSMYVKKPSMSVPLVRSAGINVLHEDSDMSSAGSSAPGEKAEATANADATAEGDDSAWAAYAPDEYVQEDADMDVETMRPGEDHDADGDIAMTGQDEDEDDSMYDPID